MIKIDLLENLNLKIKQEGTSQKVWDIVRYKWVNLSPEETVRQALIHYFIYQLNYPQGLISVEKQLTYGSMKKRYDIVIFDHNHKPWMLVECKAPEVKICDRILFQLLEYHSQILCPYWLISNGINTYCANYNNNIKWLDNLPVFAY